MIYYTEYPTGQFTASSDEEALRKTKALVLYRESETFDGRPFIMLKDVYQDIGLYRYLDIPREQVQKEINELREKDRYGAE